MDAQTTGLIVSTSSCLILSLMCSLFEAVLYAAPISLVRARAEEGRRPWQKMLRLKEHPDRPISGILITNTLANTGGAALAGFFAKSVFDGLPWGVPIFMALLVLAILWFSEIIPKTVGVVFASTLAPVVVWPISALVWFWAPMIRITELATARIKRMGQVAPSITELELASLARRGASEGQILGTEARLIERALQLDTVSARDLMTPRTVAETLSGALTLAEAKEQAFRWRHNRIPVYRADDPDEIYGLVLRRDIFDAFAKGDLAGKTVADFAAPMDFVPESAPAHRLLDEFIGSRRHMVGVIDEFGVFLGVVTLEDVIECLLGREIVDEHDEHDDMQIFAREEARRRGMPAPEAPRGAEREGDYGGSRKDFPE